MMNESSVYKKINGPSKETHQNEKGNFSSNVLVSITQILHND